MKVIFLDIDGVLNCQQTIERHNGFIGIDPVKVKILNNIIQKTGAEIVLSSSWRLDDNWNEVMLKNNIKCIDRTTHLPGQFRGFEINAWLVEHDVEKYAILDDDSDMLTGQKLFQTSFQEDGLTEDIAQQVINYLNE